MSENYAVYKQGDSLDTQFGILIEKGLSKDAADKMSLELNNSPENAADNVYHWSELVGFEFSQDCFYSELSGEDLETIERNEYEGNRANGAGSPKWQPRRIIAIGDITGITAVSPDFGDNPHDFDRIMEDLIESEQATAEYHDMIGIW